jgi:hypothetical protein
VSVLPWTESWFHNVERIGRFRNGDVGETIVNMDPSKTDNKTGSENRRTTGTSNAQDALPASAAKTKDIVPAAQRALQEAEARRAEIDRKKSDRPKELKGREGPEPVRYGDWEKKGIASDF